MTNLAEEALSIVRSGLLRTGSVPESIADTLAHSTSAPEAPTGEQRSSYSPYIIHLSMPSADTEYEFILQRGTKKFTLHMATAVACRFSFIMDRVAGSHPPYFTLKSNTSYFEDNLNLQEDIFVYVASSSASVVLQGIAWR